MAKDLLQEASREAKAKGLPDWTERCTRDEQKMVRDNAVKGAKRIARAIKKGKTAQNEIMPGGNIQTRSGWGRKSKKRLKENGGR